jgi:hypothetical protein
MTAEEVAEGVLQRSGNDKFKYTVMDPSMFSQSGGPSLAERMYRVGLQNVKPADNRRVSRMGAMGGWDQMRARLRGDGENPMLYVFFTCTDFIRTVPALQHDPDRPEDIDTDAEDHVADEARYTSMSRPWTPARKQAFEGQYDPLGKPVETKPRTWLYLSEMTYADFHKATNSELGETRRRRERM